MTFDKQQVEKNLESISYKIKEVTLSIEKDILKYRSTDTIKDERDERETMRDVRYYLLRNYDEINRILRELDRYK